ncbi:uncharacterized protein KIAA1671 homolog [Bufo bufo]|uniref:uncharacterized protein KIAA1671 homolog n=1 Tax=Bufo bufo TaxID=8384 RepID=UPI001ABE13C2|nr:uncharacterized protein KIAA1671 homolog [Bufo bufo]XP_040272506.1 uncharacterized protein KIAA1671 homolog [Bufo bufo]
MSTMSTKVELSTRSTRSDILNDAKPSRTFVSPLSDASNKSTDTGISSSLIIEDTIANPSKTVSMFNSGIRPRSSPKPFSREKLPESRKSTGMPFTFSGDVKQQSDVPFQATTSISLSGSTKSNESERVGRRIFTSSPQANTDEDQDNRSELFSSTAVGRRQTTPGWHPVTNTIGESKPTAQTEDMKVTSKPPIMSRKPELSQQEPVYPVYSRRTFSGVDESREPGYKSVENTKPENIDSLTVRDQLRQKRRPVSAVFLGSNEPVSDQKVADEPRKWNRRPLSEDLTSLFESRVNGNKNENPSEETKENRPFRKNSLTNSSMDEQSSLGAKEGDQAGDKNISSDTRTGVSGISLRHAYSTRIDKDKTKEVPSNKQQEIADVGENVMKMSTNINNQSSKFLPDSYDGSSSEVKKSDESGVVPGVIKRRLSLYSANTGSSEEADVPLNTDNKSTANIERKLRSHVPDKDTKSATEWATSPSPTVTTDFAKRFFNSPSRLDLKSEKPNEERRSSFSSQDYAAQKEKKDWQNSSLLEEKTFGPRRSIKRYDEPVQLEENADVTKDRRDYSYKDKFYDAKTDASEVKDKNSTQVEKSAKTVKATIFEHNVERHNPPDVYHLGSLTSNPSPKSTVMSEYLPAKHESSSWLEWLSGDNVHSKTQIKRDLKVADSKLSESSVGTVLYSTEIGNLQRERLKNLKNVDENRRVEPRYEVVQAVGERVLSESIEMAPEDKAVTLRSRRSFHNKDQELVKDGNERPGTSLQRSKSEYRKRNTLSPQENSPGKLFSRDTEFPFEGINAPRTEKKEFVNVSSESLFSSNQNSLNDETDLHFKEKSYESNNRKEKPENTLGKYSSDYSYFGTSATDKGEVKNPFRSFNQQSDKLISSRNSIEKDSEKGIKTVKEDATTANPNVRDETNCLTQVKEYKKLSSLNQFNPQKGLSTKNINKEESNDFTDVMLNTEIEQIKRELFTRRSMKEADSFPKKEYKEEFKENTTLLKSKDFFQEGENISDDTHRRSSLYKFERDDIRKKTDELSLSYEKKDNIDISAAKDLTPMDKKATYFAVTGIDSKKHRNDEVQSQISSNTSLTSEDYFKRSIKMGIINSNSHHDSFTPEEKNTDKDIDNSPASKELKSYKNVQVLRDNLVEKPSGRRNIIDIDALIKRHKQKSSVDDKGPTYLDSPTKPMQKSHFMEPENTHESNTKGPSLKLEGTYKSKILDVDSLMADYNASQRKDKENKARDDDHNLPHWERSRSFRESISKGSSNKWKDPSIRQFTNDEGNKYEAVTSRYSSSQVFTSAKDDLKQDVSKSSTFLDNLNALAEGSYEKDPYKVKEGQGIQESSVRTMNYKAQSTQSFESTTTEARSNLHLQGKQVQIKMSDDDQKEIHVVEREHQSFTRRGSIPEEKTPTPSEPKKTAKASDLISLMLENKERRMEWHRSRKSVPVELPQEPKMQRLVIQQEWIHSESKEFYKTEELKPHPTRVREMELVTDLSRRKSLNQRKEYSKISKEDHVKQCFSRSSTSNKDTDSLVQETDRQYGTWSQDKQKPEDSFVQESSSYDNISGRKQQSHSRLSSLSHTETDQHDSITEAREGSLDRSSMDFDSTDGTASTPSFHEAKAVDFSFVDQTSVLDSTALKNRVQLSRKSQRRAPSQSQRRSRLLVSSSQLAVIEDTDSPWMFTDSTEDKPEKKDEVDGEEEKPQRSSLPSQRMPMFPGMDHSTLMAQLRKRQETESSSESSTQPSSPQASAQPSRSPKSPLPQGTIGVKLLPTSADIQDRGASASPQWLQELKSKKRQSLYENQS